MDATARGGLLMGGFGVVMLLITFRLTDDPFALFTGVSVRENAVMPLVLTVLGALLVLYGVLCVTGLIPEQLGWEEKQQ